MDVSFVAILGLLTLSAVVAFGVYQLVIVRRKQGKDTTTRLNDYVERESK